MAIPGNELQVRDDTKQMLSGFLRELSQDLDTQNDAAQHSIVLRRNNSE